MNDPTRRAASAAYFKRREEAGLKRVTVWLDAETRAKLAELGQEFGSKDAAIAAAIRVLRSGA